MAENEKNVDVSHAEREIFKRNLHAPAFAAIMLLPWIAIGMAVYEEVNTASANGESRKFFRYAFSHDDYPQIEERLEFLERLKKGK